LGFDGVFDGLESDFSKWYEFECEGSSPVKDVGEWELKCQWTILLGAILWIAAGITLALT
jgi:hypothetical protein